MKLRSTFALVLAAVGAASPALAQTPDSVLAISQGGVSILRVNEDAGLVVRGAANVGSIPATGAGARMMWFPARYAFRAGQVDNGQWDTGNVGFGSAAFGSNNVASGANSVALGVDAVASGVASLTVNGFATGAAGIALGSGAVAGGDESVALGLSAIAQGLGSIALGPGAATGSLSTAIGYRSNASGAGSVAIGQDAKAGRPGAVVISDASGATPADSVYATAPNQFVIRGSGGVSIYTLADLSAGVQLAPGGNSWSVVSDRNRKMNFAQLDGESVLMGLRSVPVTSWSYISQGSSVRHAGPMAQDFYAAFGLGESEELINTIDIDGITLAAVKALEARSEAQVTRISELEAQVSTLTSDRDLLIDRLQALEERQTQLEALLGSADGSVSR